MSGSLIFIIFWRAVTIVEGGVPENMGEITPICYEDTEADNQFSIFIEYTNKYYKGEGMTMLEEMSRVWNGGPRGPHKRATDHYWFKINRELERPLNEMGKS